MLTLYFSPGSSSMATHIALHEVGAPFKAEPVLLTRKENRTAAYLRINPEGKVPALAADGRVITEVAATLYYLARRYPEKGLWPDDLDAQTAVVSWMSFIASSIHPSRLLSLEEATPVWTIADRRFGGGPWVLGAGYSIADIHLFRLFWRFREQRKVDGAEFPSIRRHYDRMMERPAVRTTIAAEAAIAP